MISVNNISMRYGARVLFENVTATFLSGRRYAITGPNGAGKSTFLKLLTGELEPSGGSVSRPKKLGVLRQDQFAFDSYRVIDTVIMGNAALGPRYRNVRGFTQKTRLSFPTRTVCVSVSWREL